MVFYGRRTYGADFKLKNAIKNYIGLTTAGEAGFNFSQARGTAGLKNLDTQSILKWSSS